MSDHWEIYALKYAEKTARLRMENFLFDDHPTDQAPIDGRPGIPLPVFTNSCAGAWLNLSVCIERTKATLSTMRPK